VRCLAIHGRFLEIGKFDLSKDSPLGMSVFLKNVTFHGILLDSLFDQDGEDKRLVVKLVEDGIKSGAVKPLPYSVFNESQIEEAFRFMATGKHVGKVLLKIRDEKADANKTLMVDAIPRCYMNPGKVQVIIGGLGGFGLELANWLVERGASKLVLVSRSGVTAGYQDLCIRRWRAQGVTVETPKADVTTQAGAEMLLQDLEKKVGPIGGIYNLAMVLKDGFMENQTEANFQAVTKPKIDSTMHLDKASRKVCKGLEHFVIFSSVSCGRGNAGQANYGLANSAMERTMELRKADGLPALAIQWGAIGDVGVVQDHMGGNDTVVGGTLPQRMPSCLTALDTFLLQKHTAVVASMVLAERQGKKDGSGSKVSLVEAVAHILGMKDVSNVNGSANLAELGMDSLMGVEVKQTLERDHDLVFSMQEIRQLTLAKLREIDEGGDQVEASRKNSTTVDSDSVDTLDQMDKEQIQMFAQNLMPKEAIVKLNEGKKKDNLFVVHPIEGVTIALKKLAQKVDASVWGLQCVKDADLESVGSLAKFYIKEIKKVQPKGPYNLAGYSFGCTVALEMALQLEKESKDMIKNLVFLDGSHRYVSVQTAKYRDNNSVTVLGAENEADAMCTFLMQFVSFEYIKVKDELMKLEALEERVALTAQLALKAVPTANLEEMKQAAASFYRKLIIADKYQPESKFGGKAVLIKALKNTFGEILGEDYSLSQVCAQKVLVHGVQGTHRTFIHEPAVDQVATVINQL